MTLRHHHNRKLRDIEQLYLDIAYAWYFADNAEKALTSLELARAAGKRLHDRTRDADDGELLVAKLERYSEAESSLGEASGLRPNSSYLWLDISRAFGEIRRPADALDAVQKGLSIARQKALTLVAADQVDALDDAAGCLQQAVLMQLACEEMDEARSSSDEYHQVAEQLWKLDSSTGSRHRIQAMLALAFVQVAHNEDDYARCSLNEALEMLDELDRDCPKSQFPDLRNQVEKFIAEPERMRREIADMKPVP
jgi:tetratricopeptide (TPR) repeat protein